MGVETALAIGAGTSAVGSLLSYGENRAARKRGEQASNQAQALTQGANGVDQLILSQFNKPNSGQDGYLQYLRSNPGALKPYQFDASQMFKDLQARDQFTINDQIAQLSAGAGSLGNRFGTGFANRSGMVRERFAADIAARNAGISQSSFNNALQFGQQGFSLAQNNQNQLLGLLLNSQQGRTSQQLQALGLGMSVPAGTSGQQLAQGGVDLAQLLLLGKAFGGGGGTSSTYLPTFGGGGYNPWSMTLGGGR